MDFSPLRGTKRHGHFWGGGDRTIAQGHCLNTTLEWVSASARLGKTIARMKGEVRQRIRVEKVANSTGIPIDAEVEDIDDLFSGESEINLYRIVQESLSNIVKHSAATQAEVIIKRVSNSVSVTVNDNGKGFDAAGSQNDSGFGLRGILERTRILGGRHTLESSPGLGTRLNVYIDVKGT